MNARLPLSLGLLLLLISFKETSELYTGTSWAMNMAFSPFSIVQEPQAIVWTWDIPGGATYSQQWILN